jgi:Arc/MetJ-type ribon-helix-helix transcriptional regulator
MTTVAIALKDEDRKFIEEAVKSGRYFSTNARVPAAEIIDLPEKAE